MSEETIKINGPRERQRPGALIGGQTARPSAPASLAPQGGAVRVSDLSGALAQLAARLSAEGQFDQARVDQIKEAIANGEYKVASDAVAHKLIQSVRELLAEKA